MALIELRKSFEYAQLFTTKRVSYPVWMTHVESTSSGLIFDVVRLSVLLFFFCSVFSSLLFYQLFPALFHFLLFFFLFFFFLFLSFSSSKHFYIAHLCVLWLGNDELRAIRLVNYDMRHAACGIRLATCDLRHVYTRNIDWYG